MTSVRRVRCMLLPAAVAGLIAASCGDDIETGTVDVARLSAVAEDAQPVTQIDDEAHHQSHDDASASYYDDTDMAMINASDDEVPDIDMIDVSTGATVNLQSLADGSEPLLFWFWSPH